LINRYSTASKVFSQIAAQTPHTAH
jgi:hypothetical protein